MSHTCDRDDRPHERFVCAGQIEADPTQLLSRLVTLIYCDGTEFKCWFRDKSIPVPPPMHGPEEEDPLAEFFRDIGKERLS